ncbi:hypothetical protein FJZ28_04410, partial [Candidatus Peregrinibacteria bacterium]|nr:hypothetical protein [Candidatus Peregrinibacteria bacterium]
FENLLLHVGSNAMWFAHIFRGKLSRVCLRYGVPATHKLGLEGKGYVSQIYREAFAGVEEIDTTFQERQTVEYANEHDGSETMMAPSAWGAHSPLLAARKGFVTAADEVVTTSVWARSYRVDRELDDILTVLRHIERVCISPNNGRFSRARISEQQFNDLYSGIEIREALSWAEEALGTYLQKNMQCLKPEVQTLMDMQTKRIAELWEEIPQSGSLAEIE